MSDKPMTVNEGVAIMQAYGEYMRVDPLTTLIVPRDYSEGFRAGSAYGVAQVRHALEEAAVALEALRSVEAERPRGPLLSKEMNAQIIKATDLLRALL